jgi:hypothetical protein
MNDAYEGNAGAQLFFFLCLLTYSSSSLPRHVIEKQCQSCENRASGKGRRVRASDYLTQT